MCSQGMQADTTQASINASDLCFIDMLTILDQMMLGPDNAYMDYEQCTKRLLLRLQFFPKEQI